MMIFKAFYNQGLFGNNEGEGQLSMDRDAGKPRTFKKKTTDVVVKTSVFPVRVVGLVTGESTRNINKAFLGGFLGLDEQLSRWLVEDGIGDGDPELEVPCP